MFQRLFRKLHIGNGKDRKLHEEEKSHREPIVVRIFREDASGRSSVKVDEMPPEEESEKKEHRFEPNHKYFVICVYALAFVVVAAVLIFAIVNIGAIRTAFSGLLHVLTPFIAALMIAFVINPLVNFLETGFFEGVCKIKKPKLRVFLSILVSYLIVLGLTGLAIAKVVPQVKDSFMELLPKLPDMLNNILDWIKSVAAQFPDVDLSVLEGKMQGLVNEMMDNSAETVKSMIPVLFTASVSIVKTLISVFLSVAISIYIVCDRRRLAQSSTKLLYSILPIRMARALIEESKHCSRIFGGFIVGKTIDSLIIGILCFILMVILKLDYAVLISVIVGVTNMIPYFGPFVGAVPGILIFLCIDPMQALVFSVLILALQQFDGWVLGPKILGDSTGLRPLWVIFAITVGGAYKGVLGMFLGVPVTAVVAYLVDKFITARLKKKKVDIS